MLAFVEIVPQEKCLTFCSSITTLSKTLMCASRTPSQIFDGQCCHMHPTVLVLHHQNTNSLSFKWKAAGPPFSSDNALHNAVTMAAEDGQQLLLGRNTCASSAVDEFSNTVVKLSYGLWLSWDISKYLGAECLQCAEMW